MHKPKKIGVGQYKQFGPIQKLQVPDFQHISNQYEQMQNEIAEKPNKKRQIKPFSIRKAVNPHSRVAQASADMVDDFSRSNKTQEKMMQAQMTNNGMPSLLSDEEQEALQPKPVKVENPWIYEQTHKEYLDNIKGLPARHANVIKKHHDVQKETTFLHKIETGVNKDQATKEAIALLEKEYEIFNEPNMPGVKVLTRYDTWDEDKSIEDWIAYCKSKPNQAHALSPVYQGYEYCWKPVEVLDYDYKERKYRVKVVATNQEKLVTRLSLLFFIEDPDKFKERVNQCKSRQDIVEAELRFTNLVDSVPSDAVSTLSKEKRYYFSYKSIRQNDRFDPDKIQSTFKHLIRVVEEEYVRQMKKCVILKEMEDPTNFQKFQRMKIPIRLTKKTSPYFGVVRCPKYNFIYNLEEIQSKHFSSDEDLVAMTRIFIQKSIEFQSQRFMNTNKDMLKLPRELKDLESIQVAHHGATRQNMMIQWRDFLIGEIQEKLKDSHHFFENKNEVYLESPLKRIISRFEFILNTYIREFVKMSIEDWVEFIKNFTTPNRSTDEKWLVNKQPLIIIHLSIQKKQKKASKTKAKKDTKDTKAEGDGAAEPAGEEEEDDEDKNKVIYKPNIKECRDFIHKSMEMIQESTNSMNNLESDLMPFLQKKGTPNFEIDKNFPWIRDATDDLESMINDNIGGPNQVLEQYKKYEYVLNVDKKKLIDDLFKGGENGEKKPLEDIKEQITHYDDAYYNIMTLSEDEIDFRIFRVMAKKMKNDLGDQASKIKDRILDATYNYCTETVTEVFKTYNDMEQKITHEPADEKELIMTKDFINGANEKVEQLTETLKEVYRHYIMLEEFSYMYKEIDIEQYWYMRVWPLKIQACVTEGKNTILEKNEIFGAKLDQEKDQFSKQIIQFEQQFEKIKQFDNLINAQEFYTDAYNLREQLTNAFEKVKIFHEKETLFNLPLTPYPQLEEIEKQFRPFFDLTTIAYDVKCSFSDWRNNQLMRQDPVHIETSVAQWQSQCMQLNKKLDEDFPATAEVARELKKQVDEFAKNLPLIKCFTSEAVLDEDWAEIESVVKINPFDRYEIKVSTIEEKNLYQFTAEIEEITMKAEKKFSLQQKLKAMKEEMKQFQIQLNPYKEVTFLVKGYDDINARLDDQTVATQAMLGSSFMRGKIKGETRTWEQKLTNMSLLMEQILKTQRTWMYLEPIFASDDIMKTLPTEGKMFNDVDTLWKLTMKSIEEEPGITDLAEKENIMQHFEEANKKLDKIQKSLSDYLEQKRLVFARFFFLADEDLLQILAQTKNPRLVQAHMDKCFEGISKVQFDDNDCVFGMVSAEGEKVAFINKIDVNEGEKKGNVEKWMLDIESQMISSLRSLAKQAREEYPKAVRTEWSKNYPGQIVLAVSQIYWTTEVEKAIHDHAQNGVEDYIKVCNQQIEDIVQVVRTPLQDMERITIKALIVIDVHAKEVVVDLHRKQITNIADFDWSSQLRYYWEEKDKLIVKMVTAEIPYAYEYLGNSPRLVITSLTDRCYRTLLGAKYLNYGGAPEGPAGTGKTESVKDLAKAIAVQCVVFNCSDGLDYKSMAKFFKGLAASGAWCCFDEFNRINLEVLSVIAQQIQCINAAIKNPKVKTFVFEKTELRINRACHVNITMNPGYAGRSELPDNLKALFRPCAMMVPDYALIAEIELYSFGFSEAKPLSVKVVQSLRLSSEQLSSQYHYDFGMRAVKSILTACGNQRRILEDWPEDKICLKALNDVNIPKFTSNDIPLFKGITSDLFPGVELPSQDYAQLEVEMRSSCERNNLQATDFFIEKCIQLYETIMVRHGLMVVGDPYAGKSSIITALAQAMSSIKDNPKFVTVDMHYANPKAITQNQLYGVFDLDTQEWSDGVLAIKIRDCAESQTINRKWIVFDGPVDAVWIENMNTVLDDNKKLCLNSGQIIKLKPTMTIMFEVDDLSQASPATISRCGMVLLESKQLGHNVFITSYCNSLKQYIEEKVATKLENLFHYVCDACIEFTRKNCKFPQPMPGAYLVNHMIKYIQTYMAMHLPKFADEEIKIPNDIEEKLINALLYAAIWGIGGCIDETTRSKFDAFLQELIAGDNVIEKYAVDLEKEYEASKIPNKLGSDYKSLFDLYFDQAEMKWINWISTVPKYVVDKDQSYLQLNIPTIDSIRINFICKNLVLNDKHCLLVGPTGTGKSIIVNQLLRQDFDNEEWIYYQLGFSAQTSSNQTQRIIDGKMDRKRKGVYAPKFNKEGVIFVDDLSMPQKETYGAQPPIELLRQWMDYQGWYDIDQPEKEFRKLVQVRFIGAMAPPGGGKSISSRYIRHFNVLYVEPYSDDSLKFIFSTIMDWFFATKANPSFGQPVIGAKESIVSNTIHIYKQAMLKFKPTPAKSHYTYNLRDVSKVFQGFAKSSPKAIKTEDDAIRLWAHECLRVFQDRLISIEDRDKFTTMLQDITKDKFKKDWHNLVKVEPLLFASFVPLIHPDGDKNKRPLSDIYCELTDRDKVKKKAGEQLEEYNQTNHSRKMNLVLFTSAIEHIVKIHRIITTEFGHALLIGVGGSGRKSLTELSVFTALYETFQIEISKAYNFESWRDDMRQKLFMNCGVDEKQTVFLLSDTQIIMESFLEDVNNVLNNGEIPNLYALPEHILEVMDNMKDTNKHVPNYKNLSDTEIWLDFTTKCKANVHIVLAMSPIGDDYKRRLRMFPSLVNCCAIDYFLPWPQEALQSVAEHFLEEVDNLPEKDGIVSICVDMQMRVTQLTERYKIEQKRYYYVTPTSYLVLIQAFKSILEQKRNEIDSVINKYEKGIDQLAHASTEVNILQGQLEVLMPKLEVAKKETGEMIVQVDIQKKDVAEKTKVVEAEEAVAKEKKGEAEGIQKECEFELSRVMPIYSAAIRAVSSIKKTDIDEFKSFAKAPEAAIAVVKTLCIMFSVKPDKVGTGKDKTEDYWGPGKKKVLTSQLLDQCKHYKKDEMKDELIEVLRPLIEDPMYQDDVLQKASKAAAGLAKWVRAMVQYHDAMKVVKPKQEQLEGAKAASAAAQAQWDAALEKLKAVQAQMDALVAKFNEAKAKEKQLSDDYELSNKKCNRAKSLIEKLGTEGENWKVSLIKLKADKENLVGDIIISSGVIAYLGVFLTEYRKSAVSSWIELMKSFEIKSSDEFSLREVLGNGVKIQQWTIQGLPQENVAVENAIIMDNSDRWPLMIDPQMQGNNWIKNLIREQTGNDKVESIKPTMDAKELSRKLESCITNGIPLILEDATETFDPLIEPVLGKQIEKQGNMWTIKLGDGFIEYSKDFSFYITTKFSKPHYSPEVCVKVNMLNFMVTEKGLMDQMLNFVVKHQESAKFEKRRLGIIQSAKNERIKNQLQDDILNKIATSDDNILMDDELIVKLDSSKAQYIEIEAQMEQLKESMTAIEQIRGNLEPLAIRVSRLFFVLVQIMNIDPMYQYSLKFFESIYERSLNNGNDVKKNDKKAFFIKEFTRLLYENICRSLFEKDKLLFSFLMCMKIMDETEETKLEQTEVSFFLVGGTRVECAKPNPSGKGGWMSDKIWASILQLADEFACFKGLDESFEKHVGEWERIFNSAQPQAEDANWPAPFCDLSTFRKALLLRVFRPDKVIAMIQNLIKDEKELGENFIISPAFDLEKSFEDSRNDIPIIIVLSSGADPMSEIVKLSVIKKARIQSISLGQGQEQIAIEAIKHAIEAEDWVVLQNCHLASSFLPTLDGIIENIVMNEGSQFRMWLTAMPNPNFPVTILQNGVKTTIEPPKGLKSNIQGSYLNIEESEFESCDKPGAYKALLWGLCFFHALVLERRKFGPLGWNIAYQFSASDLSISQAQLMMFLNHYEKIPWEALRYMVAEANYGGRVTDPNDRVCIQLILEDFYCPEMLKPEHKLVESGVYIVPPEGPVSSYIDYIQNIMPINDLTEIFGLHDNAEITSAINATEALLGTCLSSAGTGGGGGGGGKSQDDILNESSENILQKLPKNFDIEYASKKHPICYEDSMNTVLQQELLRFNKLLSVVRSSLINVQLAIKGEVQLSIELEAVCNSIFANQVPDVWHKNSYPSLKPLASWILNFLERLQFMNDWIENGAPPNYWISGFFFTQSFLTGAKQNYARNHTVAIDLIDYDFIIISDESKYDLTKPPPDGVYVFGLFVEGCRWCTDKEALEESMPKVLYTEMRSIWILPKKSADIDYGHAYKCPVYKTAKRFGTLSTTGHSTNFVLYVYLSMQKKHSVKHWVKRGVAMLTQLSD